MSVESTRQAMERYWEDDDLSVVAEDAVYTFSHNGREVRGRDEIGRLLEEMYARSFDANFTVLSRLVDDGRAVLEGRFSGRHTGDWEGVAATGRDIDIAIVVVYELENDRIERARVHLQALALYEQLGVSPPQASNTQAAAR